MDRTFFEHPNEHYVNRLMAATDRHTIVATEDLYNAKGVKLWAQGKPINVSLRERLLASKLNKPIEMCVQVQDGIKPADIRSDVQKILEETPAIAELGGDCTPQALKLIEGLTVSGLPHLQLSTARADGTGSYVHAVTTAAIAAFIALRLELHESAVEAAIMAGLAHDIGEMYVDPELLHGGRELNFSEWKHIAVHPKIGAVLLAECGNSPPRDGMRDPATPRAP
ncbi:MAG: HD domain-containing protein [Nevskia sp.]|nr:HD domain-containing protein [Nevskia sp.]